MPGTILLVDVQHLPKPTSRTRKTLWLWITGPDPDIETCWRAYPRRFDSNTPTASPRTPSTGPAQPCAPPEQADLWTWLIVAGYTQLHLARPARLDAPGLNAS